MTRTYYNEFDPYAAQWLRNLIDAGHLPAGDVDERSIVDVAPSDVAGYAQCHFFAGIGGWALAARLAGWPDDRELWTGSAPCQPFSVAGKQRGTDDDRHLWPHLFRLASARRPAVLMGEQVAAAVGKDWLDGVFADLESIGYTCGAAVVPAAAVDAPHRRDRLWFVADADNSRLQGHGRPERVNGPSRREDQGGHGATYGISGDVADTDIARASEERQQRSGEFGGFGVDTGACVGDVADADGITGGQGCSINGGSDQGSRAQSWAGLGSGSSRSAWGEHGWIIGHDGKARRAEPSIRLLAHGVPARVGRLRAYGNAIVPQVAAEVIGAYMDCRP